MESRLPKLFQVLCCEQQSISVQEIALVFGVSDRTVYSDVKKLNILLKASGYAPIENEKGIFYYPIGLQERFSVLIKDKDSYLATNPRLRRIRMLEHIFSLPRIFNLNDLHEYFDVSRNTLLKDLKKIKVQLKMSAITIDSHPFLGFQLEGAEKDIRNQFLLTLQEDPLFLINEVEEKISNFLIKAEQLLVIIAKELHIEWSDDSYERLLHVFWVTFVRLSNHCRLPTGEGSIQHNNEEKLIFEKKDELEALFQTSLTEEECLFLARKLSEASLVRYGQLISEKWVPFTLAVEEFIEEVSRTFHFHPFREDDTLFEGLLNHLRPAYKRAQSFEAIENPLFKYVEDQYGELHKEVGRGSSVLENGLNVQFSLQELSFFTLFFAASYERNKNIFKRIPRAILVCSAGISTSQMLKSKLLSTFEIHIEGIFSTRGAKDWLEKQEVDLILTTVPFSYKKVPSLLVTPYLSKEDKKALERLLQRLPSSIQTATLLEIIKTHATIQHPQQLEKELQQYLGISHTSSIEKGAYQPMLLEVITEEMIHVNYDCQTREEAVIESGRLLVEKGYATENYIKAMLKNVEENGTYIVIAPGIAMPHARPEEGALDIGLSIVTLKNPVVFGHPLNDPVRIVIGLCAVDHQSHLKALSELVEILGDQEKVEKMNEATTSQEIINIIKGGNKND